MTDQTTVSGSDAGRQDEQPDSFHRALSTTQAVQGLDSADVALPQPRPRCGKQSGMCAMVPDGAGNAATGICPECGVDCGNAGVGGIRYTSWCDEHGRATPCDKCQQTTNWPETVLMVRAWFEGNADAALAELEHRAKSGAPT